MGIAHGLRRLAFALLAHAVIAVGALSIPLLGGSTPASAQISDDAQVALEQYGAWRPHPRFGEVWVPAGVPPDWRPYQYGHWVYTEEWGWYWVSDDAEADWGWVVYHYGRWAFERGLGWFWVPGDDWAPAWVNWRYGDEYAGWAPLPPDELIETYEAEPAYWVFVPTRFIGAPRLRTYIVPPFRRSGILRGTHVVNRTVPVRGRLAVNPGISPAFVARVNGAPVATYRVRPRVFAATQGVSGAVQVRREDLRGRDGRPGGPAGPGRPGRAERPGRAGSPGGPARVGAISVERTTTVIRPNATVTPPQPLGKNERGRLGTSPPRAAQGTPSVVPLQQQTPPGSPPPAAGQNQTPPLQHQTPPGVAPPKAPTTPIAPTAPATTTPPATQTAPTTTTPPRPLERRDEHRDRVGPGGPPPQQPTVVRPIPPQVPPPPLPPPVQQQQRQVQPPPQRQVQPPPPPAAHPPPPPPPPAARPPAPPPPAARPPAPPPPAAAPPRPAGPPPKKPPPKPGEKPDEKK